MTTTVVVTFPWGRYHGTPWGRNVNEGVVDWPPEPWRIVRALYATWRSRAPELDAQVVASLLGALAEPPAYRAPAHRVAHTRHYFPDAKHGPTHGTDKVLDTFAVMERGAELHVTWPVDITGAEREALAVLCDRITYLGRAESLCVARLLGPDEAAGSPPADDHEVAPLDAGELADPPGAVLVDALAPAAPSFDQLEANPQRLRRSGFLEPPGSRRVAYAAVPEASPAGRAPRRHERPPVTAVRLRLTGNPLPLLTRAVAVADATRGAALHMLDAQGTGRPSVALSGRTPDGVQARTDHHHAHYLAFPAGGPGGGGNGAGAAQAGAPRVDTVVVWAAGGLDAHEVDAIAAVRELRRERGGRSWRAFVAVEAAGELADVAPELTGPARRWRSLTPYAAPRHVKRRFATWEDQAADRLRRDVAGLAEAGLLGATEVVSVVPSGGQARQPDWKDFVRHRPGKEVRSDDRRTTGFAVTFSDPTQGPVALGALRHFGLGLFVPDDPA